MNEIDPSIFALIVLIIITALAALIVFTTIWPQESMCVWVHAMTGECLQWRGQ